MTARLENCDRSTNTTVAVDRFFSLSERGPLVARPFHEQNRCPYCPVR